MPLHLGVRVIIAKSFARIHKANLINAGILPLTFEEEKDYEKIKEGEEFLKENLKESLIKERKVIFKTENNHKKGVYILVRV